METKILKKVIQRTIQDKSTNQIIVLKQKVVLMCREPGELDQSPCDLCPYCGMIDCEKLPDPRETGDLGSSFPDFCDSLHQEGYYKDSTINVSLDLIPEKGSLEESFIKFPKALRILKNKKGNKRG